MSYNAAMNIDVWVFVWAYFIPLRWIPRHGTDKSYGRCMLNFKEMTNCSPKNGVPFYIPWAACENPIFSRSIQTVPLWVLHHFFFVFSFQKPSYNVPWHGFLWFILFGGFAQALDSVDVHLSLNSGSFQPLFLRVLFQSHSLSCPLGLQQYEN